MEMPQWKQQRDYCGGDVPSGPENILVERITESAFLGMGGEWNGLLERSAANEVFLLWEWVRSWWSCFGGPDKSLFILTGRGPGGRLVGIAPFYVEKRKPIGLMERKILRLCSSVETGPDHLDFISDNGHAAAFAQAVFEFLSENGGEWDLMALSGLRQDSTIGGACLRAAPALAAQSIPGELVPYLPLEGDFGRYMDCFSAKTRQTLRRKRKLLLKGTRLEILSGKTACQDMRLKDLFVLHGARAERKGIRTAFAGERIYNFHTELIRSLEDSGKAVLAFLYQGTSPVACFYCLEHNRKFYFYQTGISPEGEKMSAGTVLLSLLIERAFEHGCSEFDFLRGDEQYKFFWTKKCRRNYSLEVRKAGLAGALSRHAHVVLRKLKDAARPVRQAVGRFKPAWH